MSINSPKTIPRLSAGFSLIELTVALLIVVLLAGIALRSTNELSFQVRYEQTQERLNRIKEAIIGNPSRTVNGQPDISGFVADMGRLPQNIRELIDNSIAHSDCDLNNANDLDGDGNSALDRCPSWSAVGNPGSLGVGWRGPYLTVSNSPDSADAFTDGWGREGSDGNYGWRWNRYTDPAEIISFGRNQKGPDMIINSTDCTNAGGTWNGGLQICSFSDLTSCANVGGIWNGANCNRQTCSDNGYEGDCSQAIQIDDYTVDVSSGISVNFLKPYQSLGGFCGFLSSQAASFTTEKDCKNAGSNWDSSSSSCTTIDAASCKTLGGKWQSCFFTSAQCSAFTGGTWRESCEYTPSSCAATGGTWNATNRICDFTSATCPGTWNGSSCDFTESSCFYNKGTWQKQCVFTNHVDCERAIADGGPGGIWNSEKPESCSFSSTQCSNAGGKTDARECYLTHQEGNAASTPYNQYSCQMESKGSWFYYTFANASNYFNDRSICMVIWVRDPATSSIIPLTSDSLTIQENGSFQTIRFINFKNASNTLVPRIMQGINAIGIYEYDGNCDPLNNPLYPSDRQQPIQVLFNAHSSLPSVNW